MKFFILVLLTFSFRVSVAEPCAGTSASGLQNVEQLIQQYEQAVQAGVSHFENGVRGIADIAEILAGPESIEDSIQNNRTLLRMHGEEGMIPDTEEAARCRAELTALERNLGDTYEILGMLGQAPDTSGLDFVRRINLLREQVHTAVEEWTTNVIRCDDLGSMSEEDAERILRSTVDLTRRLTAIEKPFFEVRAKLDGLPYSKSVHSRLLMGSARMVERLQEAAIPIVEEIGLVDFIMAEQRSLVGDWAVAHTVDLGGDPEEVSEETRQAFADASSPMEPMYYASGNQHLTAPLAALASIEGPEARQRVSSWFVEQDVAGVLFQRLTLHTIDLSGWGPSMGTSTYTHFGPNFATVVRELPAVRAELERPRFSAPYPESEGMPDPFSAADFIRQQWLVSGSYWNRTNGGGKDGQMNALNALAEAMGISQ